MIHKINVIESSVYIIFKICFVQVYLMSQLL